MRRGSRQIEHRSCSETLPHTSQKRTLLAHLAEQLGEMRHVEVGRLQDVEGDALRRLRADAGQAAEFVDEVLDDAVVHGLAEPRRRLVGLFAHERGAEHLAHHRLAVALHARPGCASCAARGQRRRDRRRHRDVGDGIRLVFGSSSSRSTEGTTSVRGSTSPSRGRRQGRDARRRGRPRLRARRRPRTGRPSRRAAPPDRGRAAERRRRTGSPRRPSRSREQRQPPRPTERRMPRRGSAPSRAAGRGRMPRRGAAATPGCGVAAAAGCARSGGARRGGARRRAGTAGGLAGPDPPDRRRRRDGRCTSHGCRARPGSPGAGLRWGPCRRRAA